MAGRVTSLLLLAFLMIDVLIVTAFGSKSSSGASSQQEPRLREVYSWSQFDFNFPSSNARQEAIRSGSFVAANASAPTSIAASGNRVFITLPRWKDGVAATLSTVPFPSDDPAPLLTPYPSWEMNREGNCEGLTCVYRVKVDECKRLWVLDTGTVNAFTNARKICPFKVVAFDLTNDQIIHTFVFPDSALRDDSQLVNIEVEYPGGECGSPTDAVLYVSDTMGFALIVVELSSGRAWRVRDKTMYPTPDAGTFNVAGETFELMDGIFALALSPRNMSPFGRLLYYNSMSSFNQRLVETSILRNEFAAKNSPQSFQTAAHLRTTQAGDCAVDRQGVMFIGLLGEQALQCWNTNTDFEAENLVTLFKDDERLQFPVSVQVDSDGRLWVIGTHFQSFYIGTLPATGTNFRVFMNPSSEEAVRGTACEVRPVRGTNRPRG